MINKILVALIAISVLLILTGFMNVLNEENSASIINTGFTLTVTAGFYLLLKNGTFQHTALFKLCLLCFSLTFIGALFKIMHWPFAGHIINISLASVLVIYSIHFYKKPNKTLIDALKLIILSLEILSKLYKFLHMPYAWEIEFVSGFIFLIFILYYITTEKQKGKLVLN